ncbi:DUF927 domain-containing protein [Thiomicrospira microaerophila]|uniref:DUF927 domain-containing protein n=1 Tax=Thiomicrospira microaerophila TaxID=406020 RepID=UPI00200F9F8E|nr:DUF927 domain-containing protein [Thiomicrospira microaerophila]UQB42759.1 DUF927 domain-containing protein [Thiomicrospira microaerophila]
MLRHKLGHKELSAPALPHGFHFDNDGNLIYKDPAADEPTPIRVCSKLEVTAITCDENYMNYGRALEFKDPLGKLKKWVMPMNMLAGRGDALHGILLDMGLKGLTSSKAKTLLANYLHDCQGSKVATCVFKTGWFDDAYVLPGETIGDNPDKPIMFQTENPLLVNFEQKGMLEAWQRDVASFAVNNSRICFAISTAFTAPLLSLFGIEGGGFHLRGESSKGKTIALYAAGSVWGSHKRKRMWRATSNGLEFTAFSHNDSLLCLDEMGEMSPKEIGATVYMLANGQAKQRANDIRLKEWRLLFLSTGELDLKSAMAAAGDTTKAGQEVRMLDIEAVCGEYGVFDTLLPGFESSKEQAEALHHNTSLNYGVAGVEFIKRFIAQRERASLLFRTMREHFTQSLTPPNANSQVSRAINRFAIVAAGGEVATELNITGWKPGEAYERVRDCFYNWLNNLESANQSREEVQAISNVRGFIERYGSGRFESLNRVEDDHAPKTIDRAGWVGTTPAGSEVFYFFAPEYFKKEVCNGLDYRLVLKTLKNHGYLLTESGGKTERLQYRGLNIGGGQKMNVYAVNSKILGHGGEH